MVAPPLPAPPLTATPPRVGPVRSTGCFAAHRSVERRACAGDLSAEGWDCTSLRPASRVCSLVWLSCMRVSPWRSIAISCVTIVEVSTPDARPLRARLAMGELRAREDVERLAVGDRADQVAVEVADLDHEI